MYPPLNKVWNAIREIKGKGTTGKYKHLKLGNQIITDKKEIFNTIGQTISKNSSKDKMNPKFTAYKNTQEKKSLDFTSENKECYNEPFTSDELLHPLFKLLMDISSSQESLLEDHLLLTNRFNLHRCSDDCLISSKSNASQKVCRMEFQNELLHVSSSALVKDRNGSMRLERDHPVLLQHSKSHTQGWRANGIFLRFYLKVILPIHL